MEDNPGEPVLSQGRDLLEQSLDFYEPHVLSAAQLVALKHYRKTPWFGQLIVNHWSINQQSIN